MNQNIDEVVAAWRVARPDVKRLVLEVLRGTVPLDEALVRLARQDKELGGTS